MNEKVMIVKREYIPENWLGSKTVLPVQRKELQIFDGRFHWYERQKAEIDENVKQIIPYIILYSIVDNTLAVYRRKGNEKRLHGLYSLGVGGHINPEDAKPDDTFVEVVIRSAKRELSEELIGLQTDFHCQFKGIINEELTKTGRTHLGLVFVIKVDKKPDPGFELFDFHWIKFNETKHNYKFELWSEMALELLKK